jgi:integral membrane protein
LFDSSLGRLRIVGLVEGVSYLVLLGVAMPLKYFAGVPAAVKSAGSAHGLLFVLYVMALGAVAFERRWSLLRTTLFFAASLVPVATLVLDRSLRREQEAARAAGGAGRAVA